MDFGKHSSTQTCPNSWWQFLVFTWHELFPYKILFFKSLNISNFTIDIGWYRYIINLFINVLAVAVTWGPFPCEQTDTHDWKHYLPTTSLVGGNKIADAKKHGKNYAKPRHVKSFFQKKLAATLDSYSVRTRPLACGHLIWPPGNIVSHFMGLNRPPKFKDPF